MRLLSKKQVMVPGGLRETAALDSGWRLEAHLSEIIVVWRPNTEHGVTCLRIGGLGTVEDYSGMVIGPEIEQQTVVLGCASSSRYSLKRLSPGVFGKTRHACPEQHANAFDHLEPIFVGVVAVYPLISDKCIGATESWKYGKLQELQQYSHNWERGSLETLKCEFQVAAPPAILDIQSLEPRPTASHYLDNHLIVNIIFIRIETCVTQKPKYWLPPAVR